MTKWIKRHPKLRRLSREWQSFILLQNRIQAGQAGHPGDQKPMAQVKRANGTNSGAGTWGTRNLISPNRRVPVSPPPY